MEQVNENNLEPTKLYYVELDNDSLRQYGAYSLKHYARFIKYIQKNHDTYAHFEEIININKTNIKYGNRLLNARIWRFYKIKKLDIEVNIINRIIHYITGDENFDYLPST